MNNPDAKPHSSRVPALLIVLAAFLLLGYVLWQTETRPSTDDAYVYADTIDVVPEVNGRIVEMPVRDNQLVKQGDLLIRIDARPYQDAITDCP